MGIDRNGAKLVLSFRIGSSENSEVCRDTVGDMHRYGLRSFQVRSFLAVLGGSKALRSTAGVVGAVTQHCLVLKERNLLGYLSKWHWGDVGRLFAQLRKNEGEVDALERLAGIEAFLRDKNGEELIGFFSLDVPSINAIENAFLNLRHHIERVCRWRTNTDQADCFDRKRGSVEYLAATI